MRNEMKDQVATVVSTHFIAKETAEMELELAEGIDPLPGQFAHIAVRGAFLRRPISIAGYDTEGRRLRLIVQRVGRGTQTLTEMQPGETIQILAPLGNPFPLEMPDEALSEGSAWLVGGGIGVAPLLYLAELLAKRRERSRGLASFVGFRDESLAFGVNELERYGAIELTIGGFVTDPLLKALERDRPSVIYACGPTALLRRLQEICRERGLRAFASLEEHMGCGIGACLVCSCKLRTQSDYEYKRVCYDGPVFDLSEVLFE